MPQFAPLYCDSFRYAGVRDAAAAAAARRFYRAGPNRSPMRDNRIKFTRRRSDAGMYAENRATHVELRTAAPVPRAEPRLLPATARETPRGERGLGRAT